MGQQAGDRIIAPGEPNVQILTAASGDWTRPDGLRAALVECWGQGTGGGGITGNASGLGMAGGGAAGGYCWKLYQADELDALEAYTVGQGGTGAANGTGSGGTGTGATTFKGMTASPGTGGSGGTATTGNLTCGRGNGGTASGGDENYTGGAGNTGQVISGAGIFGGSNRGGASRGMPMTPETTAVGAGTNASSPGCGGSGAIGNTTNRAGGNGANGQIKITTFF